MGFCQWFRYFSDRIKCTQVAEIKPRQCIIIQAILSQKLMKKITLFPIIKNSVYKAFDHKRYQWYESEHFPSALDTSCQYRKEDFKNKIMY